LTIYLILSGIHPTIGGNKASCQQCIKKIGQKVLNRKDCVYLPSRQIFKFGIFKTRKYK